MTLLKQIHDYVLREHIHRWRESFPTGWKQHVTMEWRLLQQAAVVCGVPQGPILEPVLNTHVSDRDQKYWSQSCTNTMISSIPFHCHFIHMMTEKLIFQNIFDFPFPLLVICTLCWMRWSEIHPHYCVTCHFSHMCTRLYRENTVLNQNHFPK